MASVTLKNVRKSYGKTEVIKGINLNIEDGEFMVFVGPSGCGKSTLLRIIAGLEKVTEGEIYIGGRLVNNLSPAERDVAMVFQSYALYPHFTVRENLEFGLKVRKVPKEEIDKKVKDVATLLGISHLLERYPRELSGGQRQRVAMGRAIVRKPQLFLFDEPLSNLDAALRSGVRVELSRLHQKLKTTMIYVTHDQVEAMTLADRIAVIKEGMLQQVGSPYELYTNPENLFVASFIGSPPMNFIKGGLKEEGDRLYFESKGVKLRVVREYLKDGELSDKGDVILGIRPHDFEILKGDAEKENKIELYIEVIEPLGWEYLVHCSLEQHHITLQVPGIIGKDLIVNTSIKVAVSPFNIYLFDGKTEKSIIKR